MQAARAGRTLLPQAIAVFIVAAGFCCPVNQTALAATDETKSAAESEPEALKLPPNQLDAKELKTLKTPFSVTSSEPEESSPSNALSGLKLTVDTPSYDRPRRLNLGQRLVMQQFLYLPGSMVLGKTAEFTVKGKPGSWAALAMADKDTGAKPILGHKLRLGPDRKVVAAGQIPASGLLTLDIETPIEGDLIGEHLYFEAVTWSKPDMSDVELLSIVPSVTQPDCPNGVLICAEQTDKKRGLRKIIDTRATMNRLINASGSPTLESGKP